MNLPAAFIAQMQSQLGSDFDSFKNSLGTVSPTSIRWNNQKHLVFQENYEVVNWFNRGVYLPTRPIFTLDPLLHAGVYYVQEASSMFVAEAARQAVDLYKPLKVLDLCAAPGGKSTLLASILNAQSLLFANEVIRARYQILQENMVKWGVPNTHIGNADSRDLAGLEGFFDLVMVDAPCSGEGLFRKDKKAMAEWSPTHVTHCAARQKRILADAVNTIKSGGALIYCTCTYNDEENEDNVKWLIESFDLERLTLQIPTEWNITSKEMGYQFYPHRVRGEGFYISCFRKKTGIAIEHKIRPFPHLTPLNTKLIPTMRRWLEEPERFDFFQDKFGSVFAILQSHIADCQLITQHLRKADFGIEVGKFKNQDFIPAHALALNIAIKKDLPAIDLDKEQALHFLKKDNLVLDKIPIGWSLVRYKGHNLGWIKGVGNRVNNYFPKNWRILMELPSDNF